MQVVQQVGGCAQITSTSDSTTFQLNSRYEVLNEVSSDSNLLLGDNDNHANKGSKFKS
jgi:hypothetical protein